ncbi:hypothetical protein BX661DRAFT_193664 [Kickxella alabastrina]|uniref:uncharacterized protein n=1 Tax=Kickxella alabastrina TaxID=61397 RepID=UPI00221F5A20|nr:uncharacterized protein BX661DRAFT_193664 [Kickxella alabastrina]KAI7829038.1 hypothetical protein BX661DRAFT_193664 [Kickxella alabastrina]
MDAGVNGVLRSRDFVITAILTLLSLFTRLYKIGRRPNVTWDEAHFGKFGAFYINHTFYHDVHPPLAKMLVGLAEVIAGHNGTFKFGSGDNRAMSALAASFVLFDNALCVMSRFILLDQPLLFFTALTLWSATGFQNVNMSGRSHTRRWWTWLLLTGFSLGCVMSSKWIGLFCVIMEVLRHDALETIRQAWAARILALIIVPLTIYVACFWLHFHYLYRTGSGDHKLSAKFQAHLKGNKLNTQPYDITYGAFVDLRAVYNGPGLLHSHIHQYPTGSRMQQVTCFPHRDTNNVWQLQKAHGIQANYTLDPIEFVNHGDIVQVVHNTTGATLRASKHVMAPLTTGHFEVAAENITDSSESGISNWHIEIVEQQHSGRKDKRLHAMTTMFRLRHADSGCLMRVGSRRLPKWGWNQSEVTCLPDSTGKKDVRSKDVLWYIERNINKRVQKDDLSKYVKSNFFIDMIQLNVEMGKTNNALGPDPAGSWPFLLSPMRMVGWGDKTTKYYEIGNPLLWWASALVCIAYPFRFLFWLVCIKRRCPGYTTILGQQQVPVGRMGAPYIPFFFMGRVTYIHHYLPRFTLAFFCSHTSWTASLFAGARAATCVWLPGPSALLYA